MDQGTAPDLARWSLRPRGPAHEVSRRCLELQRGARPRGMLGRLFGQDPLHPDAVAAYRGALGQLRVGRLLGDLGPGWTVLHGVPVGDADIDHLVIGPGGVFAIDARHHVGRHLRAAGDILFVDGAPTAVLPAARHLAQAASRTLSRALAFPVHATPLVASVAPRSLRHGGARGEVDVVRARALVAHLRARATGLGPELAAAIARAAEELTTWRPLGDDVSAPLDPGRAFALLRAEVDRARARRMFWRVAASVALALLAVGTASGLLA